MSAIGPGGCVTWTSFEAPAIWALLAYEDGRLSAEQAAAWDRTHDLLASHAKNLRSLRDELAVRWPPARSEASAVFLGHLDELIGSVEPASYAASTNAVVLSDLVDTLADARERVRPVRDRWASAAGDTARQAALNGQAAAIMAGTDVAVYEHGQRFIVPDAYEPPVSSSGEVGPVPRVAVAGGIPPPPGFAGPPSAAPSPVGALAAPLSGALAVPLAGALAVPLAGAALSLSGGLARARPSDSVPLGGAGQPVSGGLPVLVGDRGPSGQPTMIADHPSSPGGVPSVLLPLSTLPPPPRRLAPATTRPPGEGAIPPPVEDSMMGPGMFPGMLGGRGASRSSPSRTAGTPYLDWPLPEGTPTVLRAASDPSNVDPGPGIIGVDR